MYDDERTMLDGHEEVADYRSVSRLAILALCLGFASILALFHPLSWVVPIAAVIVAGLALRATSDSERALDGSTAAMAGACLAIFFGVAAVSFWGIERSVTARQGRRFVDRFLEILQSGDYARAVECTQTYQYRQPDTVPLAEFYVQDEKARELLQVFKERAVVRAIMESGKDATIRFVRVDNYDRPVYGMRCWLRYRLTAPGSPSKDFVIVISRRVNPESTNRVPHWSIQELEFVPEQDGR